MLHLFPDEISYLIINLYLTDRLGLLRLINSSFNNFITNYFSKHKINKNRKYIYYESDSLKDWCIKHNLIKSSNIFYSVIRHTKISRQQLFPIDGKKFTFIVQSERIDILQQLHYEQWFLKSEKSLLILFKIAFLEIGSECLQDFFLKVYKDTNPNCGFTNQKIISETLSLISTNEIDIILYPLVIKQFMEKNPLCKHQIASLFANYRFWIPKNSSIVDFLCLQEYYFTYDCIILNKFKIDPVLNKICKTKELKQFCAYVDKINQDHFLKYTFSGCISKSMTPVLLKLNWSIPFEFGWKPVFDRISRNPLSYEFLKNIDNYNTNHDNIIIQILINDNLEEMSQYLDLYHVLFLTFEHYEFCSFEMFQFLKLSGYVAFDISETPFVNFKSKYDNEWVEFLLYFFALKDDVATYDYSSLLAHLTHFTKSFKDQKNNFDLLIIEELFHFALSENKLNENWFCYLTNSVPIHPDFFKLITRLPHFCPTIHHSLFYPYDLKNLTFIGSLTSNFDFLNKLMVNVESFDAFKYLKDSGFHFNSQDDVQLIGVIMSLQKTMELDKINYLYENQPSSTDSLNLDQLDFLTPDEYRLIKNAWSQTLNP